MSCIEIISCRYGGPISFLAARPLVNRQNRYSLCNLLTSVLIYPRKTSQLAQRGHLKISIKITREDEIRALLGYEVLLEVLVSLLIRFYL